MAPRKYRNKGKARIAPKMKKVIRRVVTSVLNREEEMKALPYNIIGGAGSTISQTTGTSSSWCFNVPSGNASAGVGTGVITKAVGEQGVGQFQHIGNKIRIKKLQVSFKIYQNAVGASTSVRVMMIRDKQAFGIAPTLGEILLDVSAGNSFGSAYRLDYQDSYDVMYDKVYEINQYYAQVPSATNVGSTSMQANGKFVKIVKKVNIPVEYYPDTTSTTWAGIQRNALWIYFVCDNGFAAVKNIQTCCYFTDA